MIRNSVRKIDGGPLEYCPHPPSVAKSWAALFISRFKNCGSSLPCVFIKHVSCVCRLLLKDFHQFVRHVIWEINVASEPRTETGIGANELLHFVWISSNNDHEAIAVIFHGLE